MASSGERLGATADGLEDRVSDVCQCPAMFAQDEKTCSRHPSTSTDGCHRPTEWLSAWLSGPPPPLDDNGSSRCLEEDRQVLGSLRANIPVLQRLRKRE